MNSLENTTVLVLTPKLKVVYVSHSTNISSNAHICAECLEHIGASQLDVLSIQ